VEFRPSSLNQGDPLPLFSGDKLIYLTASPDRRAQVVIQNTDPVPSTIVALMYRGVNYD
jgi:hypothetical protein